MRVRRLLFAVPFALAALQPGGVVEPWKPGAISSPLFESHAAFDPRTGDLYFVRSSRDFAGWHLLTSHCTANGWSKPQPPSFAAPGLEADPFFGKDGSLYFISTRSTGSSKSKDLDIWQAARDRNGGFLPPARLPEPVNTANAEWFPRLAEDGWLYFGSNRPGGHGRTDIWRARAGARGAWTVENLGPAVNTDGDEFEAEPAPGGSRLVIMTNHGLYESKWDGRQWLPRTRLDAAVNVNDTEVGALFSPDGKSLLFSRDTKGADSGEFFVLRLPGARKTWPPSCPAT